MTAEFNLNQTSLSPKADFPSGFASFRFPDKFGENKLSPGLCAFVTVFARGMQLSGRMANLI